MNMSSLAFCASALVACLLIGAVAYPFASISVEKAEAARSVVNAEDFGALDLGDFGEVPVEELVTYYLENPPEPPVAGAAPKKVRFEGC